MGIVFLRVGDMRGERDRLFVLADEPANRNAVERTDTLPVSNRNPIAPRLRAIKPENLNERPAHNAFSYHTGAEGGKWRDSRTHPTHRSVTSQRTALRRVTRAASFRCVRFRRSGCSWYTVMPRRPGVRRTGERCCSVRLGACGACTRRVSWGRYGRVVGRCREFLEEGASGRQGLAG